MHATTQSDYKYDVAFSFLARDARLAQSLADALTPGLEAFVYNRQKETVLGGDGMDVFADVFGKQARLAVILYRDGWGNTPWTAFEESHIKDHALHARMHSFIVVRLDNSELPSWIPSTHLYLTHGVDSENEIAGIIRYRAREQGAQVRRDTAVSYALRKHEKRSSEDAREQRFLAHGPTEIIIEIGNLFTELGESARLLSEQSSTKLRFGRTERECAIAGSSASLSLVWEPRSENSLREAWLRVNDWHGPVDVPRHPVGRTEGRRWSGAIFYRPILTELDSWAWQYDPSRDKDASPSGLVFYSLHDTAYSTHELAEVLFRRFVDRLFTPEVDPY